MEITVHLECYTNWSMIENSLLKFQFITFGDVIRSSLDCGQNIFLVKGAILIHRLVWVSCFTFDAFVVLYILECMGWQSTIASVVIKVTSTIN